MSPWPSPRLLPQPPSLSTSLTTGRNIYTPTHTHHTYNTLTTTPTIPSSGPGCTPLVSDTSLVVSFQSLGFLHLFVFFTISYFKPLRSHSLLVYLFLISVLMYRHSWGVQGSAYNDAPQPDGLRRSVVVMLLPYKYSKLDRKYFPNCLFSPEWSSSQATLARPSRAPNHQTQS